MKRGTGIVVEMATQNRVVVMTSQGEFVRVPFTKPVCVGQEIHFEKKRRPSFWQWSIAAVVFLAIVGSAGMDNERMYIPGGFAPTHYVTIDINPSIELALNREQRIVAVEGLNDDGRSLLYKARVVGSSLKQGVEVISAQARADGYYPSDESEIVVTISSDELDEYEMRKLEQVTLERRESSVQYELEDVVRDALASDHHTKVKVWQVPMEVRDELRQAGVTPARYIAVYVERQTMAEQPSERTPATNVTTTLVRNDDVQVFEFQVTRPVLTPVTLTRAPHGTRD